MSWSDPFIVAAPQGLPRNTRHLFILMDFLVKLAFSTSFGGGGLWVVTREPIEAGGAAPKKAVNPLTTFTVKDVKEPSTAFDLNMTYICTTSLIIQRCCL